MFWLCPGGEKANSKQLCHLHPTFSTRSFPLRGCRQARMDVCELQPGRAALVIPHVPGWPTSREGSLRVTLLSPPGWNIFSLEQGAQK